MSNGKFLVIDLEATCDNGGLVPRHEMEIIEIGALIVESAGLTIEREFQSFVRPVRHVRLTPFCRQLTTITQDQVDDAPTFPEAMEALGRFVAGSHRIRFCSWGNYDKNQFRQDARLHDIGLPFNDGRHLNLKQQFSDALRTRKRFGLGQALQRVGLQFDGTAHRGIDDARNIARLMPWILGRQAFPPEQTRSRPRRKSRRRATR